MKRNVLLVAVFGALVAFAASRVYAATIDNDQDIPFSSSRFNFCTGNTDTLSGTQHLHISQTVSPSGTVHLDVLEHTSNLTVQDATLGECSGQNSGSLSLNTTSSALPFTTTSHSTTQFECPGAGSNFSLDSQFHVTINPDGTTAVAFDKMDFVCR